MLDNVSLTLLYNNSTELHFLTSSNKATNARTQVAPSHTLLIGRACWSNRPVVLCCAELC